MRIEPPMVACAAAAGVGLMLFLCPRTTMMLLNRINTGERRRMHYDVRLTQSRGLRLVVRFLGLAFSIIGLLFLCRVLRSPTPWAGIRDNESHAVRQKIN